MTLSPADSDEMPTRLRIAAMILPAIVMAKNDGPPDIAAARALDYADALITEYENREEKTDNDPT